MLGRHYFGFLRWRGHDAALWNRVQAAAAASSAAAPPAALDVTAPAAARARTALVGRDTDARVLRVAAANAQRAGVAHLVRFESGGLEGAAPPTDATSTNSATGLLCTNPPYGVRLGDREQARQVHVELGRVLRESFAGWRAAILTSAELGLELGLRAARTHTVWNGALECRLLRIDVDATAARDLRPRRESSVDASLSETPGAKMFANRITKNLRHLSSWVKREQVDCYRIYDADMPEYSFAIDLYSGAGSGADVDRAQRWLHVQEYAAPRDIPEDAVRRRRSEALAGLLAVTGVPVDHLHLRTRRRNARGEQYTKLAGNAGFHAVRENGLGFWVNFTDYLDTGLFLDHRITRARLRDAARGAHFLNLFGYTGTASVYAAAGGARSTTTVDLSNTYLDWARRNLELNGLLSDAQHFVHADVREWLGAAEARGERYDLIFCDPPTFSNSKRMEGVLDVQRDHAVLIEQCMRLLRQGPGGRPGLLVFSTNAQRFALDGSLAGRHVIRDVSRETLPLDFARNPKIHQCFEISRRA